ncbi:MAG: hypothetical protein JNL32_15155, partial [Candidatus Kapabacteria bacterium]|nr:hypothetical protein [Candidatus Kapabacteria bacterium]
ENPPSSWNSEQCVRSIRNIRASSIIYDTNGRSSDSVGASVSGFCIFMNPNGKEIFSGGVTPERGHRGRTKGIEVIEETLNGDKQTRTVRTSSFGCKIQ